MQYGQGRLTEADIVGLLEAEGLPRGSERYLHALHQRYYRVYGTNLFIEREEVDFSEGIPYCEVVQLLKAEGIDPQSSDNFEEEVNRRFSPLPNGRFCLRVVPL